MKNFLVFFFTKTEIKKGVAYFIDKRKRKQGNVCMFLI